MTDFLHMQRQRLAAGELDAAKLAGAAASAPAESSADALEVAAWMLTARAVMNLDEAVVKR